MYSRVFKHSNNHDLVKSRSLVCEDSWLGNNPLFMKSRSVPNMIIEIIKAITLHSIVFYMTEDRKNSFKCHYKVVLKL